MQAPLILIVDDSEDGRTICAEYLEYYRYRVLTAEDGQQALDLLADHPVDVVVMDLSMPVLDGLEAARRLKRDERTRAIPLIALTAYATRDKISEARANGFDSVLTKPCLPAELEAEIRRMLAVERTW